MALTNTESKPIEEKKTVEPRYFVVPRYGWYFDEKAFIIEIALPGVSRDTIKIKALHDYFTLTAQREEIGYKLALEMGFEIDPAKIKATYHEGLLKVELPIVDPMSRAVEVKID